MQYISLHLQRLTERHVPSVQIKDKRPQINNCNCCEFPCAASHTAPGLINVTCLLHKAPGWTVTAGGIRSEDQIETDRADRLTAKCLQSCSPHVSLTMWVSFWSLLFNLCYNLLFECISLHLWLDWFAVLFVLYVDIDVCLCFFATLQNSFIWGS